MRRVRYAIIPAMSLVLGACAGTGSVRHSTVDPADDDFDSNKVATVTQWAQTHGATVIWINYPTKPRSRGDGN